MTAVMWTVNKPGLSVRSVCIDFKKREREMSWSECEFYGHNLKPNHYSLAKQDPYEKHFKFSFSSKQIAIFELINKCNNICISSICYYVRILSLVGWFKPFRFNLNPI